MLSELDLHYLKKRDKSGLRTTSVNLFNNMCILLKSVHSFTRVCSNMNASSFITFFKYMLRQNGKRFYKGLYVTFKLAPNLKKNTVYLSSNSPLN